MKLHDLLEEENKLHFVTMKDQGNKLKLCK